MESLQGKLLISSVRLMDPNFVRTVVLMVQHSDEGALGVVLNRPLKVSVKEACEQAMETTVDVEGVLHQGGPCEGPLMAVHTAPDAGQGEVFEGVYFTTEREHIVRVLAGEGVSAKFFVGYAGWGPAQLEAEMESGSWLTSDATAELVFGEVNPWSRLVAQKTLQPWVAPERIPPDPSVN